MVEAIFEVKIPKPLLDFGIDQTQVQQQVVEWLVLSLFTQGQISSGQAARLLNINRLDFLALLRQYGVAYIDSGFQIRINIGGVYGDKNSV